MKLASLLKVLIIKENNDLHKTENKLRQEINDMNINYEKKMKESLNQIEELNKIIGLSSSENSEIYLELEVPSESSNFNRESFSQLKYILNKLAEDCLQYISENKELGENIKNQFQNQKTKVPTKYRSNESLCNFQGKSTTTNINTQAKFQPHTKKVSLMNNRNKKCISNYSKNILI